MVSPPLLQKFISFISEYLFFLNYGKKGFSLITTQIFAEIYKDIDYKSALISVLICENLIF